MSGAVSRRLCSCTDIRYAPHSMAESRRAENRQPNDITMEYRTEHRIKDRSHDDRHDVVAQAADRNRQRPRIGTMLETDTVIDRPGQHRTKQNDSAEIAIGAQVRHRPGFDADQHRML